MPPLMHAGRHRLAVALASILASTFAVRSARADPELLWDNGGPDMANGLASETGTAVSLSRSADDFRLPRARCAQTYQVTQVTAELLVTFDLQNLATFEIWASDPSGAAPTDVEGATACCSVKTSSSIAIGRAFGYDLRECTAVFSQPCLLKPDTRYWLSVSQEGAGSGRGFMATAREGTVTLQPATFKSNVYNADMTPKGVPCSGHCFPKWTPSTTVVGQAWDLSFRIYGTCGTGAVPASCMVPACDAAPRHTNEVVVLWCGGVGCTPCTDVQVLAYGRSACAPLIDNGSSCAETIARLLDDGFVIKSVDQSQSNFSYTLARPPD